jgi:hypothetical protein
VTSKVTRLPDALVTVAVATRSERSPPELLQRVLAFRLFQVVCVSSYDDSTRYALTERVSGFPPATVSVKVAEAIGVPAGMVFSVSNFRTTRRWYVGSLLDRVERRVSDERLVSA